MKKLTQAWLATLLLTSLPSSAQDAPEQATAPTADNASDQVEPPTTLLRLRSGAILFGHVVGHSAEKLRFKRIDTGGVVSLPWSFLDPTEEAALRLELGYTELASEELMVEAERFKLRDGSELLGVIDGRDSEFLWIKNVDGRIPVPLQNIDGSPAHVRAPALEIYTRQELYLAKSESLGLALVAEGRLGAEAHDELAQYCERLFDYARAFEHYTYVDKLDSSFDAQRIGAALQRAELKASQQEQLDFLSSIDLNSARERFDRALAGLELFEERYPESPLREDWVKLRDRVKKAQLAAVLENVRLSVYSWTSRLVRAAVREKQDYASLLAYLEDDMQTALFEGVRSDLSQLAPDIDVAEIKRIWLARKLSGARPATYGVGTWLLGKERAQKSYAEDKQKDKQKDEADKPSNKADERKQLEERIEKYIKNQQLTRKAQSRNSSADEEQEESFWSLWNYTSKWHWAEAYFAENSELFKISSVTYSRCRECGGSGILDEFNLGGAGKDNKRGSVIAPCPTCHTLGVVRRFRYR